jgi:CRP-like cAMP-binding protein
MLINEGNKPTLSNNESSPLSKRYLEILQKLSSIEVYFGIAKPDELFSVFDKVYVRNYKAGNVIFSQGSPHEKIYILKEGQAELYQISTDGKRLSIARLIPGSVFGVRGILSQTGLRNFAEAIEDCIIFSITKEQFMTYLKNRPEIPLRMLEAAGENLAFLEERLMKSSFSPIKVRLAYFLLTNADPISGLITDVTHEEIGNNIGAIRETVTEILNLMRQKGLVRIKRKQIQLLNWNGLLKILNG